MMEFHMFTLISKQPKIFKFIIIKDTIDMMYNFYRRKISPELFLHNKAMLHNITMFIAERMIGLENKNISTAILSSATLPIRIFRSHFTKTQFFQSFRRMGFIKKILETFTGKTHFFFIFRRTYFSIIDFMSFFKWHNYFLSFVVNFIIYRVGCQVFLRNKMEFKTP